MAGYQIDGTITNLPPYAGLVLISMELTSGRISQTQAAISGNQATFSIAVNQSNSKLSGPDPVATDQFWITVFVYDGTYEAAKVVTIGPYIFGDEGVPI